MDAVLTRAETAPLRAATDPTTLFEIAEGMYAVEALTAAAGWLNLFEWLADTPATLDRICDAHGLARRPAHVLMTLLSALDLVRRDAAGTYRITGLCREHMLPDAPWSLMPCYAAIKDRPVCRDVLQVLKTGDRMNAGGPPDAAPGDDDGPPSWLTGMNEETFAEFFLAAIDSRNAYLSDAICDVLVLDGTSRLLDVGGGSGLFACALAGRFAGLEPCVLEKPPVDAVARRAIERRGLADRVGVLSGDMMADPLPAGFDAHLYSNVVHDWGEPEIARLLAASFDALPAGGRILIHDAFLNEAGDGPLEVAKYSVLLMLFTEGRCYGLAEMSRLLGAAGFTGIEYLATAVHRHCIVATKPGGRAA